MANNQYVNKVVYGDQTLIDLTNDSVNPGVLLEGYTAHMKTGARVTGSIQYRSPTVQFGSDGKYKVNFAYGLYSGTLTVNPIYIPIPESGITNSVTVKVPNNVANPDPSNDDDWIPLTIEVNSNGNSNVTDDTIPATGVSF